MSLGQHLTELRKRFIIGLAALVVGMVAAYFLTDWIIWAMTEPIRVVAEQRGEDVGLMIDTVTGAFDLRLRISFAVGIIILCLIAKIISLPVKLLWKFITNSLIGAVMLWVVNLFGAGIPIDIVRALIAGIFGIPGVLLILIYQHL